MNLSYPLFNGGRVRNSTRAAEARVESGRADLRATEGDVFTAAVTAYMDVIRDQAIVELNVNNVKVLETNLDASRNRFQAGDLTRTDVSQSEARLSLARAQLTAAESQLVRSRESYLQIIGSIPSDLQAPPALPVLPETADRTVEVALSNNPDLQAVAAAAKAADYDISVARAARAPVVGAVANSGYANALGSAGVGGTSSYPTNINAAVGLAVTVPFYQGGLVGAQVRQAQAVRSRFLEEQIAVERGVIATARATFASYRAALE